MGFEAGAVLNDSPVGCQSRVGDRARRRDRIPILSRTVLRGFFIFWG